MGMGGDLAYKWLTTFAATNNTPFVLVVEGALQNKANGGAWGDTAAGSMAVPWCSIGMDGTTNSTGPVGEIDMPEMAQTLAESPYCGAVIGIGQCATYGGYPGCKPPITTAAAHFDTAKSQTDALGTLRLPGAALQRQRGRQGHQRSRLPDEPLVVRSFGCLHPRRHPQHPERTGRHRGHARRAQEGRRPTRTMRWESASTSAVAWMRLVASRPSTATRSTARTARATATTSRASTPASPATPVACRRSVARVRPPSRSAVCTAGTTSSRPTRSVGTTASRTANPAPNGTTMTGGHCTRAGHPCMACTEKGYPDSFVPFVVR